MRLFDSKPASRDRSSENPEAQRIKQVSKLVEGILMGDATLAAAAARSGLAERTFSRTVRAGRASTTAALRLGPTLVKVRDGGAGADIVEGDTLMHVVR